MSHRRCKFCRETAWQGLWQELLFVDLLHVQVDVVDSLLQSPYLKCDGVPQRLSALELLMSAVWPKVHVQHASQLLLRWCCYTHALQSCSVCAAFAAQRCLTSSDVGSLCTHTGAWNRPARTVRIVQRLGYCSGDASEMLCQHVDYALDAVPR